MFERDIRVGLTLMFAPLYAGPIAAGWSAAPPTTLAIFAAVFFLIQLRFGRAKAQTVPAQISALGFLALVQICIVAITYGVGMALTLLTGPLPLPLWFPLALTGCSAAFGALRYRKAQDDAAMIDLIDRTINTLETGAPFDPDMPLDDAENNAAANTALSALYALPDTATAADIDPIVQRLAAHRDHAGYWDLLAKINTGYRNVDFALLRFLASAKMRAELIPEKSLGPALEQILEGDDPAVLSELVMLIETLLSEGAQASALPSPQTLIQMAKQFPALTPLIARVQKEHDIWQPQDR